MKKLIPFLIAALLTVNVSARVRTSPPEKFTVLQSRCIDTVEYTQVLVEFAGKSRIAVISSSCTCVLDKPSAIFLFGFSSYSYVKPKELFEVMSILNSEIA